MVGLKRAHAGLRLSIFLAMLAGLVPGAWAQAIPPVTPPSTPAASTPAPAAPAPESAATPTPAPATTPAPVSPAPNAAATPAKPATPDSTAGASPGDASISEMLDVQPRPAAVLSGSASWDDGFKVLTGAFATLNDALAKNGLVAAGRPLAVFTATDDAGFKYQAMLPLAMAPEGKTELTPDIKISETPSGKAIRFQHRAAYDDIDSTYEAITAYLDEKGLESRNLFAEEYLKMTKTSDDPSLEVDIYVFLK